MVNDSSRADDPQAGVGVGAVGLLTQFALGSDDEPTMKTARQGARIEHVCLAV